MELIVEMEANEVGQIKIVALIDPVAEDLLQRPS